MPRSKGDGALRRTSPVQRHRSSGAVLVLVLLGLAGAAPAQVAEPAPDRSPPARTDAELVACLLPAEIERLGQQLTMLGARQRIETSRADCRARGGEVSGAQEAAPEADGSSR